MRISLCRIGRSLGRSLARSLSDPAESAAAMATPKKQAHLEMTGPVLSWVMTWAGRIVTKSPALTALPCGQSTACFWTTFSMYVCGKDELAGVDVGVANPLRDEEGPPRRRQWAANEERCTSIACVVMLLLLLL